MEIRPQRPTASIAGATPTPSLKVAEAHLADLADQLEQAKIEALLGIHYDADAFDGLVSEYRRAHTYVLSLRRLTLQLRAFAAPQPDLAQADLAA